MITRQKHLKNLNFAVQKCIENVEKSIRFRVKYISVNIVNMIKDVRQMWICFVDLFKMVDIINVINVT